jgi:hypothetical protein
MSTHSFFDINRLKNLLVRQISFNYKILLIATGAIAGLLLFIGTMMLLFSGQTIDQKVFLGLIMPYFFVGGYVFSSVVFSELNSPHRGYLYLTLPASTFEKLISSWLVCSVGYVLFLSIVMYVINLYYITIAASFTLKTVEVLNIFTPSVLKMFGVYMVTQSIFFLGAIYFRRVNFLKTFLALFVLVMVITFYSGILSKLLFFTNSFNNQWWAHHIGINQSFDMKHIAEHVIVPIAKTLFWGCTAPFFLLVSYYRLKEREV